MAEKRRRSNDEESTKRAENLTQQIVAELMLIRPKEKISLDDWLKQLTNDGTLQKIADKLHSNVQIVKTFFKWSNMHRHRKIDTHDVSSETYWNHWREFYEWEMKEGDEPDPDYTENSVEPFVVSGVPKVWNTCYSAEEEGEITTIKFILPGEANVVTRATLDGGLTVHVGNCYAIVDPCGRLLEVRRKKDNGVCKRLGSSLCC